MVKTVKIRRSKSKTRVYNKDAKDGVRGWEKVKPHSVSDRRKIMYVCGPNCFGDPKNLKYPVCPVHINKKSECGPDCKGLLAAYIRSRQWKRRSISKKVKKSAERLGCQWTKGKGKGKGKRRSNSKTRK